MKKFIFFSTTIFITGLLAGVYGIIHDQITFTISPEYFTKFKYIQFGFDQSTFGGHRFTVAVIGFLATWWVGIIFGIVIGLTGFIFKDYMTLKKAVRKVLILIFCITALTGIIGFFYGKYHFSNLGVNWWIPENLLDRHNFIIVGTIHNFSYTGGLIGLIAGVVYLFVQNSNSRKPKD